MRLRAAAGEQFDIVIAGPFLDHDLYMAEALSYHGFRCVVLRFKSVTEEDISRLPAPLRYFSTEHIVHVKSSLHSLRILKGAKCIVTYSGLLTSFLRYFWLLYPLLRLPPIVNLTTGSDITEWAEQRGRGPFMYRQLLRRAAFSVISPYPQAISALQRLRLPRFAFIRYPHLLPVPIATEALSSGDICFGHVSNLDWAESDNKPGRNSTKGNDRFIRAFARAVKKGARIRCKILDRGPDRLIARQLVSDLGVTEYFEWLPPVAPSELPSFFSSVDVVVDQFDVGGFGGIALEAMACARPVLTFIDLPTSALIYQGDLPIINCRTESEIELFLSSNSDRQALRHLGDCARVWVNLNHGVTGRLNEFVLRLCVATGLPLRRLDPSVVE